ncbi:MAG: hypothetical protein IT542_00610 [Rubellimicrobium sp.]|nr:hypothetical protein [Rubellimicrobium sp.]
MPRTTGTTALALALALTAASPAAADLRAEDVWATWGTFLSGLGATRSGTLHRDGDSIMVEGAGAAFDLPFGLGLIRWQTGPLVLSEAGDGSVRLTVPGPLSVSLGIEPALPGRTWDMTLTGEVVAEALDSSFSGDPGDVTGSLSAGSLELRLTGSATGPGASPGALVASLRAEGLVHQSRLGAPPSGEGPLRLSGFSRMARLRGEATVTQGIATTHEAVDYRALSSTHDLTLPVLARDGTEAVPSVGAAVLAGLDLGHTGSSAEARFDSTTHENGRLIAEVHQAIAGSSHHLSLSAASGLSAGFAAERMTMSLGDGGGSFAGPAARDVRLDLALPLAPRPGTQRARLAFDAFGIEADDGIRTLFSLPAATRLPPVDLSFDLEAEVTLTAEPGSDPAGDRPPAVTLERITLSRLALGSAEMRVSGEGRAEWPGGVDPGAGLTAPRGGAAFVTTGAHAALDRLVSEGAVTPGTAAILRGVLAFIGRPAGADHLETVIELTPAGPVLNGLALPF